MNVKSKRGTVSLTCYADEQRAIERVLGVLNDIKKYGDGEWPKVAQVLSVGLSDLKGMFCKPDPAQKTLFPYVSPKETNQ